ncbi:hypothetical protein FRC02_000965 [Tulasnella sp. 418]|nr:hypothetical protein FRC02_000965 [Tulasnella sp. 418]
MIESKLYKPMSPTKLAAQQITKISNGVVDLLINNAAIFTNPELELTDETAQGLEHEFHVNVTGPILFTNAILPLLKSSDEKRVVFLSSMAGSLSLAGPDSWPMTFPGSTYSITKVALIMATRKYAVQFKDAGFTFGAILTTEESVGSMNKVFESLSPKDNGRFLDYDGKDFAF